jgi:hypothetical protein
VTGISAVTVSDLSSWLNDRKMVTALLKQHLHRSRLRMRCQADKGRSERQFKVGDLVFLKLQPYVQTSLAARANQKLAFKYFGPFKIVARIGQVAYKLLLPESSSIHPVFHVSQLKQAVAKDTEVISTIPSDVDLPHVPEKILQRRLVTQGLHQVQQILVKWSNWPMEMVLTVNSYIKVRLDLQADKSPVVVKGPFFPRVVNPRYRICGTNV